MKHFYDLELCPLKYIVVAIFLMDYYLFWKQTEARGRGDDATNISAGLAAWSGMLGSFLKKLSYLGKNIFRKWRKLKHLRA